MPEPRKAPPAARENDVRMQELLMNYVNDMVNYMTNYMMAIAMRMSVIVMLRKVFNKSSRR